MTIPLRYLIASIELQPCTNDPPCVEAHDRTVYRLPDGTVVEPQIGDVYIEPYATRAQARSGKHYCAWTNCDGQHLNVLLPPDGHPWNVDGRASNCDQVDETTHRCWVRHGDPTSPSTLHVDKNGHTCSAGAGSIAVTGYHGHLHNGVLT